MWKILETIYFEIDKIYFEVTARKNSVNELGLFLWETFMYKLPCLAVRILYVDRGQHVNWVVV